MTRDDGRAIAESREREMVGEGNGGREESATRISHRNVGRERPGADETSSTSETVSECVTIDQNQVRMMFVGRLEPRRRGFSQALLSSIRHIERLRPLD